MPWNEFATIEAVYFQAGEYPWTRADFYEHSEDQHTAAPTIDPIVCSYYADTLVAESDGWWEVGYLWSTPLMLDDEYRLVADVVRFTLAPLGACRPSVGKKDDPPTGLLMYEVQNNGADAFDGYQDDILRLCKRYAGANTYVSLLSVWACDAGKDADTWVGAGEYWQDYQLIGAIAADGSSVRFEPLEDA